MSCNCIDHRLGKDRWRSRTRGTAEVELILLVPVLLTILLLCAMASRLGHARLTNVREGERQAYEQVVRGDNISRSTTLQTVPGVVSVHGDLPTRFDESLPATPVTFSEGWLKLGNITLQDKVAFLDPAWHYSAWPPALSDQQNLQTWFEDYVEEPRGQDTYLIKEGLGLADPWPP
jgi:hypothetical protein